MATTTWGAIRDGQVTTLKGLTPLRHQKTGFLLHDGDEDFEVWCEMNFEACLRRYTIEMTGRDDTGVSNTDEELVIGRGEFRMAYPTRSGALFGGTNGYEIHDVIEMDFDQINRAIGADSTSYVSGQHACFMGSFSIDRGPAVTYVVAQMEVTYEHAEGA